MEATELQFYGFLANGLTSALIGPDASVDWLPLPHFDSPSIFTRLLGGENHGFFRIGLPGGTVVEQHYLDRTHVLVSSLSSPNGRGVIHDYLTVHHPELRRIVEADTTIVVELFPSFDYGRVPAHGEQTASGLSFWGDDPKERLQFRIRPLGHGPHPTVECWPGAVWRLPPGRWELSLCREDAGLSTAGDSSLIDEFHSLEYTARYWQGLLSSEKAAGTYQSALERSILVLHGLVFQPTGGAIAAPTTSLPETIGGTRQWDYRFVWVRDASYMAEAFVAYGDGFTARRILEFLLEQAKRDAIPFAHPLMRISGERAGGERELDWLPGFRASVPCREGNAAAAQLQLDVAGDLLFALYQYAREFSDPEWLASQWVAISRLAEYTLANWRKDDASLWEFRGCDDQYTHSKVLCWVALYYAAKLARSLGHDGAAARWERETEAVREMVETRGFNAQAGHYTQTLNGRGLDAALLLLPLYGYCDVLSPRFQGTLDAVESKLADGPWVYRYREDMFGRAAHPFLLATSWLARVYTLEGDLDRAEYLIDHMLGAATDLGLIGEHTDPTTLEPRGNFPQGFSHLGVVAALLDLIRARQVVPAGQAPRTAM